MWYALWGITLNGFEFKNRVSYLAFGTFPTYFATEIGTFPTCFAAEIGTFPTHFATIIGTFPTCFVTEIGTFPTLVHGKGKYIF